MENTKQITTPSLFNNIFFLLTLISTFFSLSIIKTSSAAYTCRPASCHPSHGPVVRFPFRLGSSQSVRCGYPGFDLHCNSKNQTILDFKAGSGKFVVEHIDYEEQALFVSDPDNCLPRRILTMDFTGWRGSPFGGAYTWNYTFLNCSGDDYADSGGIAGRSYMPFKCLSGENYTVVGFAGRVGSLVPDTCRLVKSVSVPVSWRNSVVWSEPRCRGCEASGGACGFRDSRGLEIGCYGANKSGLPRSAKYGIIIGLGIPAIVCIIGLICYTCGLIQSFNTPRGQDSDHPTALSYSSQLSTNIKTSNGLDSRTIASYPKMVLGESRRDAICPICLGDYRRKEAIRTIPECDHYFHACCIDEWLRLNGTCPLCRNSPASTIVGTPRSSSVLFFSSASSSSTSTA